MVPLKEQLDRYMETHQSAANKLTRFIGVPAVLLGVLILLNWIELAFAGGLWSISFAWIAIILMLVYYFRLNFKVACLMTIVLVIFTVISWAIGYPHPTLGSFIVFLILFVGGWILLFIGHTFEVNKVSFYTVGNLTLVTLAPLFLVIEILNLVKMGNLFDVEYTPTTSDNNQSDNDSENHSGN